MKIGYARVSTADQNLDRQLEQLREEGCEEVFTDKATGRHMEREGIQKAFRHLREGDTLVVTSLSRLGRSVPDLTEKVEDIEDKGAHFLSLEEKIDTTSAAGKLIFHVFAAIAEFQANIISERTRRGLANANGGRKRKIEAEDMPLVSRLMKADDIETGEIAGRFGVSRSTLYNYVGPDGEWRRYVNGESE